MEMNRTTLETNSQTSKLTNWKKKNLNPKKRRNKNLQHLKKRKIPSIFPLTFSMCNSNRTKNQQFIPKRNPKILQLCSFKMMVKKNQILLLSWVLSLRKDSQDLSSELKPHQRKMQRMNLKPPFCHLFQNKRNNNHLDRLVMNIQRRKVKKMSNQKNKIPKRKRNKKNQKKNLNSFLDQLPTHQKKLLKLNKILKKRKNFQTLNPKKQMNNQPLSHLSALLSLAHLNPKQVRIKKLKKRMNKKMRKNNQKRKRLMINLLSAFLLSNKTNSITFHR